ncbi:MAG: DUF2798 domain-containing protein [Pseudomonadota bacterium]
MIPARFSPVVFGFFLSCLMSLLVSGVSTLRALGLVEGLFSVWMSNWLASWAIAFPAVLVVAPIARRLVALITR